MTIYSLGVFLSRFGTSRCSMPSSNCCFLTCIQISQEAGKVVWYSHLFQNFSQFVVIHTVSVGKESACSAGDPSLIPGSGRSAGEGMGYLLQYSWASLVAQLEKNLPAVWETWIWSLGWEDPLEKGKATHSSILARKCPWTIQSMGSQKVRHDWATFTTTTTQSKALE